MHGGWQLFSPALLVEVKGSVLKRWVSLYAFASVWRRGEREKHTGTLVHLASPSRAGWGVVWCGVARRDDGHGHMMCASIVHQNLAQSLIGS
jgi:hypothetical protein